MKRNAIIDYITNTVAPSWRGKYLTIIVDNGFLKKQLGNNYPVIELPNKQGNVLVLGWLLTWRADDTHVEVAPVKVTFHEPFFKEAFATPSIKLIVGLLQIGTFDPETEEVYQLLRKERRNTPIVVLRGHMHKNQRKEIQELLFWEGKR
jgi:hypothetical protein